MDKTLLREYVRSIINETKEGSMPAIVTLQRLVSEAVTIAVEKSVEPGEKQKPLQIFTLDDDQGDEVEFLLRKFGTPKTTYKTDTSKKEKPVDEQELRRDVIDFTISQLGIEKADEEKLYDVIRPWGQDGIDALERIAVTQERTGKKFPFFSITKMSPGDTIRFPDEPSPATVDYIANLTPRIGKNDTGRGELLLALLTGAIAGGNVGDLDFNGKKWEVKATDRTARLGVIASTDLVVLAKKWWSDVKTYIGAGGIITEDAFISSINNDKNVEKMAKTIPGLVGEMTRMTREAIEARGSIEGIVVVGKNKEMKLFKIEDIVFAYISTGRAHITFSPIEAERKERERVAAEEKLRKEAEKAAKRAARDASKGKKR